jgi:hypothetical protein
MDDYYVELTVTYTVEEIVNSHSLQRAIVLVENGLDVEPDEIEVTDTSTATRGMHLD